jgi:hypothetical protein
MPETDSVISLTGQNHISNLKNDDIILLLLSSWLQIRRPGFDSRLYQEKVLGLERGLLSLVSTTEEVLDRKVAAPVYKNENTALGIRHADHMASSIRKSWQSLRR